MNAAEVNIVRIYAGRGELLSPAQNNAIVAFFHDTSVECGLALLVRGFTAIDLRRNNRVSHIDMFVPHSLIERDGVIGKRLPAGRKHVGFRRVTAEEPGNMVESPAHQAECGLSPGLREKAARLQVRMSMRYLICA